MNKQHWQDRINVLLGLWVFASPWFLPWFLEHAFATEMSGGGTPSTWNLWIVGLAVVVIAGMALYASSAWEEWVNLVLGAWLVVSPWVLGFSASAALMWNAVIMGILVIGFAGWVLAQEKASQQMAK